MQYNSNKNSYGSISSSNVIHSDIRCCVYVIGVDLLSSYDSLTYTPIFLHLLLCLSTSLPPPSLFSSVVKATDLYTAASSHHPRSQPPDGLSLDATVTFDHESNSLSLSED